MKKCYVLSFLLLILIFTSCNHKAEGKHDQNIASIEYDSFVKDSLWTKSTLEDIDSVVNNQTHSKSHPPTPTIKQLEDLKSLISTKLIELKDTPIGRNVWNIKISDDKVQVYLALNTFEWQNKFRDSISSSPYLEFHGESWAKQISSSIHRVVNLRDVKLKPSKSSFPVSSKHISFILTNNSDKWLHYGVENIIAFKGPDGQWYRMFLTSVVPALLIGLGPTGNDTIEERMAYNAYQYPPGNYRMYKEFNYENSQEKFWLMTEFTLK